MARYDVSSYVSTYPDGRVDIWSAKFINMRFSVTLSRVITVTSGFEANLPALAKKYLEDQNLWWAILHYNGLIDPIHDIRIGAILRIPDRNSLINFLENQFTSVTTKFTI